jgi:hypothetical protein
LGLGSGGSGGLGADGADGAERCAGEELGDSLPFGPFEECFQNGTFIAFFFMMHSGHRRCADCVGFGGR